MFNPIRWLWQIWHGEDDPVAPVADPEPVLRNIPVATLQVTLSVSNDDDEYAGVGEKPIEADSLL